jgi:O-antigen/teichoic acid export membrane protein
MRLFLPRLFMLGVLRVDHLKGIFQFGRWQGVAHVSGSVGLQIDRYLLATLAPLAVVGQYNVAMRLQEAVHMGLLKISEVLFPHFSVTASEAIDRRATTYLHASWILNTIAAAALAPLIPLSSSLLTLWVGKEAAEQGAQMLVTLAVAGILGAGFNVFFYFAMGTGQNYRIAKLAILHSLVTVGLSVALLKGFGPSAVGAGFVIASFMRLLVALSMTERYFRVAIRPATYFLSALLPLLTGLVVAWAWITLGPLKASNWLALIGQYFMVSISVTFIAVIASLVSRDGRQIVRSSLDVAKFLAAKNG